MMRRKRRTASYAVAFWLFVLVGVGMGQRWLNKLLTSVPTTPVALKRPLSTLPPRIGTWYGQDIEIDSRVMRVAGTDDHVMRRYIDELTHEEVDVFVAYTSRPANMLGHHPDKCYPLNGWQAEGNKTLSLTRSDGPPLECKVHYFSRDDVVKEGRVVLNYFVLQGKHTTEPDDFWGPKWRKPNFARDPSYYVAQVQVVSAAPTALDYERSESAVKRFAVASADEVDALLPLTSRTRIRHATGGEPRP